jgi:hypothetical protein
VAKAKSSPAAVSKRTDPTLSETLPVYSFPTLLADLATLTRNRIRFAAKHCLPCPQNYSEVLSMSSASLNSRRQAMTCKASCANALHSPRARLFHAFGGDIALTFPGHRIDVCAALQAGGAHPEPVESEAKRV